MNLLSPLCFLLLAILVNCMTGPTSWPDYGNGYQASTVDTYSANAIPFESFAAPTHVTVTGLIVSNTWNQAANIGFLPSQLAPTCQHAYAVQSNPNAFSRIDVTTSGNIVYQGGSSGPNWLSFANLFYPLPSTSPYYIALPFASGWSNIGSPFCSASYYTENNFIYLQGFVSTSNYIYPDGTGSLILTLPSYASPPIPIYHSVVANYNQPASILINTNGQVSLLTLPQNEEWTGWVSLDGITFPTYVNNWTPCTLNSDWSGTCDYLIEGTMVFVTGVVINWNPWSSYPVIFTLPSGARPAAQQIFMGTNYYGTVGASNTARLDVAANGEVIVTGVSGAEGTLSLNNIKFIHA